MKRIFAIVFAVLLCTIFAVSAVAEEYTIDANGNAVFATAVGHTFAIEDINGKITGEDATILTSIDGLANCGVWSVYFIADRVSDNVYVAASNGTPMGGTAPSLSLNDGQIIVVIHSASSRPTEADLYPNWKSCAVASAVHTGDYLVLSGIDLAAGTCNNGTVKVTTKEEAGVNGETSTPVESSEVEESSAASSEVESSVASSEAESSAASSEASAESSVASSASSEADKTDEGGLGAWLYIIIGAVAGAAIVAVAAVLKKKK